MTIKLIKTMTIEYSEITDSEGVKWRLDRLLTGDEARREQVYPGFSVIYVSEPDSESTHHRAITIPDSHLEEVLSGNMILIITPYAPILNS
jgi:hypothetical protein